MEKCLSYDSKTKVITKPPEKKYERKRPKRSNQEKRQNNLKKIKLLERKIEELEK